MEKKFASRIEVASILGIDRRTFSSYCTGKGRITNINMRKKLFDITGIETFKSHTPDTRDSVLLTAWADLYIEAPSNRKNGDKQNGKDGDVAKNGHDSTIGDVDIAVELRNWFNNQYIWKTQKEIAEHIGTSNSVIKKVFQGLKRPEGIIKQKLYDMTKLECFRDNKHEIIEEKNVDEDNISIDNMKISIDKMEIPIYEVETSIDKQNGHTKKMKIPIHEVKTLIIEIKEPAETC